MNLTHDDVQEILRLLDASSFDELQLETSRFKLTLRRSATPGGPWTQEVQTLSTARVTQTAAAAKPAPSQASTSSVSSAAEGLVDIRAPIIGTFYRAPKPGADPFVQVGSRVEPDTVVGIVETMKLMNSVYAGARGEVAEICASDGQLVEQHAVLMRLRPPA